MITEGLPLACDDWDHMVLGFELAAAPNILPPEGPRLPTPPAMEGSSALPPNMPPPTTLLLLPIMLLLLLLFSTGRTLGPDLLFILVGNWFKLVDFLTRDSERSLAGWAAPWGRLCSSSCSRSILRYKHELIKDRPTKLSLPLTKLTNLS